MILPDLSYETKLWQKGINNIVGIDEVGRGSWAGPLVAAGVILPKNFKIPKGLTDSKLVAKKKRIELAKIIKTSCLSYFIAEIPTNIINEVGIGVSTQIAFLKIIKTIVLKPEFILLDAFKIKGIPAAKQMAIIRGDQKSASIASASIIAKVYRDDLMCKLANKFPLYDFEKNKGYGTKKHQDAIQKFGFCDVHRTGFNLNFLFT